MMMWRKLEGARKDGRIAAMRSEAPGARSAARTVGMGDMLCTV